MNNPIFKIHGLERRALKKELSLLKSHVNNFWFYHNLSKDMAYFYGGYPMSDEQAQDKFDEANKKIMQIKEGLSVKYSENETIQQ